MKNIIFKTKFEYLTSNEVKFINITKIVKIFFITPKNTASRERSFSRRLKHLKNVNKKIFENHYNFFALN